MGGAAASEARKKRAATMHDRTDGIVAQSNTESLEARMRAYMPEIYLSHLMLHLFTDIPRSRGNKYLRARLPLL
jgi:hypothetical protein